jgi:hypothetical protein
VVGYRISTPTFRVKKGTSKHVPFACNLGIPFKNLESVPAFGLPGLARGEVAKHVGGK